MHYGTQTTILNYDSVDAIHIVRGPTAYCHSFRNWLGNLSFAVSPAEGLSCSPGAELDRWGLRATHIGPPTF